MNFKTSKVKGIEYIQLWHEGDFICSVGSPKAVFKKLVRLNDLERQTNPDGKMPTNFSNLDKVEND